MMFLSFYGTLSALTGSKRDEDPKKTMNCMISEPSYSRHTRLPFCRDICLGSSHQITKGLLSHITIYHNDLHNLGKAHRSKSPMPRLLQKQPINQ
jgi:hypothetical protein